MTAYLTLAAFKVRSLMPESNLDALEVLAPGWVDAQLEHYSRAIDARLRKRYATPFDPAPDAVKEWLTRIVTLRAYLRRGVDPLDPQFEMIKADSDAALAEIKEAADSETGLFDLPALDAEDATGISKGGPFGYSEAGPYSWTDVQAQTAREEDRNGEGSYG